MYNGKELLEAIISYDQFMKDCEKSNNLYLCMAEQYGRQCGNSKLPKIVRKYKGKYRINETLRKSVEVAKEFEKEYGKPLPIIQEYLESNPEAIDKAEIKCKDGVYYRFDEGEYLFAMNTQLQGRLTYISKLKPTTQKKVLLDRLLKDQAEYYAFIEEVENADNKKELLRNRFEEQTKKDFCMMPFVCGNKETDEYVICKDLAYNFTSKIRELQESM